MNRKCRPGVCEKQAVPGYLKPVFSGRAAVASLDSEVKEECLREDLKFYFMSPCEKYRARRQIPWKLALQILKIVMVTTQVTHTLTLPSNYPVLACRSARLTPQKFTNLKPNLFQRAEGRSKFNSDDLVLIRDHEATSPQEI